MKTKNINEMIDRLNTLRASAGLPARKIHGTSKQTVQLLINKAERGEFC